MMTVHRLHTVVYFFFCCSILSLSILHFVVLLFKPEITSGRPDSFFNYLDQSGELFQTSRQTTPAYE